MKNRFIVGLSLLALVGAFIVNGCKNTATDPTYVALAEIRFADYHQIDPIQIQVIPPNATPHDSATWTPTPLTYGIVTPYYTNIPTNRVAGETYHLAAINVLSKAIVAREDVTLKPGDKYTWLISGNGIATSGGAFDQTLISDNVPASQTASLAYYRFVNVVPNSTLSLRVGDPLNGMLIGTEPYKSISPYVGIPFGADTSVTLFVVDPNGVVLGLLSGVEVDTGGYRTVTWGGQDPLHRILTNGATTLADTFRVRIWNDDLGNDFFGGSVPQTFRYNLINALIPPWPDTARIRKTGLVDYTQPPNNGLAIVINDNSDYNFNHLLLDSLAPKEYEWDPNNSNVAFQVPTIISPFNPLSDKLYFKLVKPIGNSPSSADSILFRFFAGNSTPGSRGILSNDQLYTIVVFDTVRKPTSTETTAYDSSGGVATIPIPNAVPGKAKIVFGNMLAPIKGAQTSNNKGTFTISGGATFTKTNWAVKSFDSSITATPGVPVNFEAKFTDADPTFTIANPEDGAIYEVFLVGKRDYPDPNRYHPQFIAVRVNPIRP